MQTIEPVAARPHVPARVPYSVTRINFATAGVSVLGAMIVAIVAWSMWNTDWSARPPSAIGIPILMLVVILGAGAVFSCFTVEVRDGTLSWWFGLGAFRREVRLSAIQEARPATASWFELHRVARRRAERAYGAVGGDAVALSRLLKMGR